MRLVAAALLYLLQSNSNGDLVMLFVFVVDVVVFIDTIGSFPDNLLIKDDGLLV